MSDSLFAHWDRSGRIWTQKVILEGIRKRVRSGKQVHYSAVWRGQKELYWTAQRLFGSWKAALRAAGVPREAWTLWPKWSRARIVDAIRKRYRSGRAVQYSAVWKVDKSLYWAAQRHWGSWKAALRAASIPRESWTIRPKWSRDIIADAVRRRFRSGKPVHYSAIRRADSALYKAALRHLGNWRTALRLADIPERARRLPPGRRKSK